MSTQDENYITSENQSYTERRQQWQKIRDVIEGEDQVKEQATIYLPQPSAQNSNQYEAYKKRASFYGVSERTLRGMVGLIFRNEPQITLPTRLDSMIEEASNQGHSMVVLVQEMLQEVLSIGRYGLLLDYPAEARIDQAPYIAAYTAENIVDWTEEYTGGQRVLTRVLLREDIDNPLGNDYERFLELLINDGVYEVRRWITENAATPIMEGEPVIPMVNGAPLYYIPFVFVSPYNLKASVQKPPFLDLANINLAHYRNSADYEHALYLTAQPTPFITGNVTESDRPKSIGSGTIWILPEGGSAGMLEFSGSGVQAQRDAMSDKEQRMASLGARMINDGKSRNEAADTARMRGQGETSLLSSSVMMCEQAIIRLLKWAAEWVGASQDEVSFKLNRDWVEAKLTSQELDALVRSWQGGAISRLTLHENLQKGELIPMLRTAEEEQELVEADNG